MPKVKFVEVAFGILVIFPNGTKILFTTLDEAMEYVAETIGSNE